MPLFTLSHLHRSGDLSQIESRAGSNARVGMYRSPVFNVQRFALKITGVQWNITGVLWKPSVRRRGASPGTVQAGPHAGAEARVSESAPISRRRVGRHCRCSRLTRGGDSIYHDKCLTREPILPARTANQYRARYWSAVRAGKIGSPARRFIMSQER